MRFGRSIRELYLLIAVFFGFLLLAFSCFSRFAVRFDALIGAPVRRLISAQNARISFSVTELLLLCLPFLLLLLLALAFLARRPSRMLFGLLSFLLVLLALYTVTFAAGAYAPPLAEALGLADTEPTAEELSGCAEWLSSLASAPVREPREEELARSLREAFSRLEEGYAFPVNTAISPKRSATPILGRLGFFGLYAFPLGEITVAAECTGAVAAFTLAHEMAHASGVVREPEADLVAFLACLDSGDPYLTYAGAAGMLSRLLTALHTEDPTLWQAASDGMPDAARDELVAAGETYDRITSPTQAPPEVSYSETVRLLCALYRTRCSTAE